MTIAEFKAMTPAQRAAIRPAATQEQIDAINAEWSRQGIKATVKAMSAEDAARTLEDLGL